ncbi:MAG: hypothetical protein L3J54_05200 [Draconibacterium sp.]|nr:hypothetical protein [Draconibacterium sp.]
MKLIPFILLLFTFYNSFSQQDLFQIEGRIIGAQMKPVADAYIFNFRNLDKNITNSNGVFSIWVKPGDSLTISHVSYFRKTVTVHSLLINPIVQLEVDTINIKGVNVSPNQKTDTEKAMENIESIKFDFRPQPGDDYTETERMSELISTENAVERAYSSSISLLRFSPSEKISNYFEKRKKRRKAKEFESTKKLEK